MMKQYLPIWTDNFPDPEQQYDLCWISANCQDDPRYSLLPIRYYGRGNLYYDKFHQSYTVNKFYPQMTGWHWLQTEIIPANYFYAEMLYKTAAEQIFEKYPNLPDITFLSLNSEGIYPVNWAVPYDTLLTELKKAIEDIYESGFYIDEYISVEETFDEYRNTQTVKISGVLIGSPTEISRWYYNTKPENYLTRKLKKQYRISLKKCYDYYRIFSEDELTLGNQTRKYYENEIQFAKMFEAADNRDFEKLTEYVRDGFDLNTIGRLGATAFARFCDTDEYLDYDKLDELISLGANPALYGCDRDGISAPLWNACITQNYKLAKYFLSKGVNPIINTEPDSDSGEFLIDRLERWLNDIDSNRDDRQLIKLLKKYTPDTEN